MNTKVRILFYALIFSSLTCFSQGKKPTLIVLPSDNWCQMRYFMTKFDNQGVVVSVPNYKKAFQEDTELGQVIAKLSSLMVDLGYPLKDAESEYKNIEQTKAEDIVTESSQNNAGLAESSRDKLLNRVKADIVIEVWWQVNNTSEGKVVSFTIKAVDAYTSKAIASATGFSKPTNEYVPEVILKEAKKKLKNFWPQLDKYFKDLTKNGREIKLTVRRWNNWDKYMDTEFNGKELNDYIVEWMQKHTYKGIFSTKDATDNFIKFEQVQIPIYDQNNTPLDARQFAKNLQLYLKSTPFNIDCKLMTRGLGEAIIVLGEK